MFLILWLWLRLLSWSMVAAGAVVVIGAIIRTGMAAIFVEIKVVVGADIAGQFRLFLLFMEGANNRFL